MKLTPAPIFDDDYTGPRWRYGLKYRPASYANIPKGWIVGSPKASRTYRHGTVDYPRELSAQEIAQADIEYLEALPASP